MPLSNPRQQLIKIPCHLFHEFLASRPAAFVSFVLTSTLHQWRIAHYALHEFFQLPVPVLPNVVIPTLPPAPLPASNNDGSIPNPDQTPSSSSGLSAGPSSATSTSASTVSGAADQDDPAAGGAVRFDRAHELFEQMKSQTERLKFAAGEVIFRSGARSMDRVFVLLSGKVVAFKESQSGADLSGRPSFASSSSTSSLFPPSTADATFATATSAPAQALSQRTIAIGEVLGGHAALTGALHGARGICVLCPIPLTLCRGMISAHNMPSLPFLSFRTFHLCYPDQAKRSCACRRAKWPSCRRGRFMAPLLLCLSLLCSAALSLSCSRPSDNLSRWVCRYAKFCLHVITY